MIRFEAIHESTVVEKDEHRKSKEYKKLSPKMKDAVDAIFKKMDSKPSDFLNSFEKTMSEVSKKYRVGERELTKYFEREMLSIQGYKMAYTTQTIVDSDFETVTKTTITGTNGTATKVVDVSALSGAATDPRVSIVSCWWPLSSQTDIEWNATTNVVALSLNGSGNYNGGSQFLPSIPNDAGTGIDGDIYFENDAACVGTIVLRVRKVSGFDNIT